MWYANSLEFDRYITALQREQKVFEDLIQQKAYIVLPDIAQVMLKLCHLAHHIDVMNAENREY